MDEPEIDYIYNDTTCNVCFAEFLDLEDLEIHNNQVHNIGILDCQFCTLKLRSIEDYALHIRDVHLDINICQFCTRVFMDENCYRKHEKKHIIRLKNGKYSCSQCELRFNNTMELEMHEFNSHKGDADGGIWLQYCLPHLSSVLNMNLRSVLLEGKSKFVCSKCGAMALSLEDYTQHLKNANCRSLCCNTCSTVFKTKKSLCKHFTKHSECHYFTKNFSKQCTECLKDFPIQFWKYHQKSCKAVKCQICEIVFEKLDDLAKHQTEYHPLVISVLVCKYCQKEFVGKVGLEKHIERTHNIDQYKYKCVYCEMVFKHPQKLFAHFFTKHKEIEPYFCCLCNKYFKIRKNFTIHIKLVHKSVGSVEFDEKFHVYFKEKKSKTNESDTNNYARDSTKNKENTETELKNLNCENTNHEIHTDSAENSQIVIDNKAKSNFMATDTEVPTDNEVQEVAKARKQKGRSTRTIKTVYYSGSDSSDDQPLLVLRSKKVQKRRKPKKMKHVVKNRFTCQYCNKQCNTYHSYHHHMNTAHENESVKCVKCLQVFDSKIKLSEHIAEDHSSSKLMETLKKVLAEQKKNQSYDLNALTISEKFQRTIKKVDCSTPEEPATLKSISKELSVQKFIESFTPESNEIKKNIIINSNVSIKTVNGQSKSPIIKLTKFQPKPNQTDILRSKLAMPVRFNPDQSEPNNITIRVVNAEHRSSFIEQYQNCEAYYDNNDNYEHYEEVMEEKHDHIPEVAHEVMLEGSEEAPKPKVHKVVIPNIPKEMSQVRIATLLPEAPYYKIIKISDVLKSPAKEAKVDHVERDITLPNGKKLVSVNPLAHLLGDTPIEKIMGENRNAKYYQPKMLDFEKAVAKALMKTPVRPPKKKRKFSKVEP